MQDLSLLTDALSNTGHDGYLIDAASTDSDQRYLSGFDAPDPFFTLYTPDTLALLVTELEYNRAKTTSNADTVHRYADYNYADLVTEHGRRKAHQHLLSSFITDFTIDSLLVPHRFPLASADTLRSTGLTVTPDTDDTLTTIRARKTPHEIDHIRTAQHANEAAMAAAEALLATATITDDTLYLNDEPLTAQRVKQEIEITLLHHGCGLDETIVAGGHHGADPHDRGTGPLPAHEPIVIDIFPRDKTTKYHSDMTRTYVRGTPTTDVTDRFSTTQDAFNAALEAIEPGVTGETVHNAVCDTYEAAGYPTLRSSQTTETGFIHTTGHGVGLDVHELPRLAPGGPTLEPGHVITIEPGLYHPDHGGIRLEDMIVITTDGYENITNYPKHITPTTN